MFEGPELYETGSDLEMSSEELFHEIAVYECGEEIAEETAAFYEEHIRGKMDVVQMSFVKKGGEVIECHGYYRLEGSVLEYGYLTKGILGSHLTMETKEYDICFNGRNLELARRGVTRTLTPYGFDSMAASEPGISGYASSEADAYEGIAYIHVEDILSGNARAEIRFTDGSLAAAPSVRHTGDNTLTIQIEENGISKIVRYLSCGKIGFILQTDDGKNYLYQKSKADYYRENLREFAADLTDDDLNDLEDDLLTEMVRKKEEIASAIEEAREKSGCYGVFYTDCEVDQVNGTLMFSNDVLFDGDGTLTAEGKGILGNILPMYEQEVIGGYGEWIDTVYLETHSDSEGDYDYNMAASQLAAELMEIWCEQNCQEMWQYLEAEGYGSDFPVYDENGEEDSRRSRRTVLRITLDADAFASYMQDAVAEDEEAL